MLKIKDVLEVELQDDETSIGGVVFAGEKVKDFIDTDDVDLTEEDYVSELNKVLKENGIKEII